MKPNAMKRLVVRTAVKKGIEDVKENSGKSVRNLVDIAEKLGGDVLKDAFFKEALTQLKSENSAYFRLVKRVADKADTEYLTEFGVNMGYNVFSHGVKTIQKTQQAKGFQVPWCLLIELQDATAHLAPKDVAKAMQQGIELGIYCYIVQVPKQYPQLEQLMQTLAAEKDCAVLLLVDAEVVTPQFAKGLLGAKSIGAVLNLDTQNSQTLKQAADNLLNSGCIAGGFCKRPNLAASEVNPALLAQADALGLAACVVWRKNGQQPCLEDDVYAQVIALRETLSVPVFPMDLYADIVLADRVVSPQGCLATLKPNGTLALTNAETGGHNDRFSLHTTTLEHALRICLPLA